MIEDNNIHPADMAAAQPVEAGSQQAGDPIFIGTKEVSTMMGVSPDTLRNYVWLLKLTDDERTRRGLQSPPKGMPMPKSVKGKNKWPARVMRAWVEKWMASRNERTPTGSEKPVTDASLESEQAS